MKDILPTRKNGFIKESNNLARYRPKIIFRPLK